jgi:hypothetical protein
MFLSGNGALCGKITALKEIPGVIFNHDLARSYAYRWGEDAIAGFCDAEQVLCIAPVFWNEKDPYFKIQALRIDLTRKAIMAKM